MNFRGTNEFNRYDVHLSWPKLNGREHVTIYRIQNTEKKTLAELSGQTLSLIDKDVEGGESISYEIVNKLSDSLLLLRTEIKVPEDLVLTGEILLTDIRSVGRLFLESGLVATTQGRKVTIQADQIISKPGAKFQSFPKGKTATPETSGRPGGSIYIFAARATGSLEIEMRGEHGGDGRNGSAGQDSIEYSNTKWDKPTSGDDGTSAGSGGNSGTALLVLIEESDLNCRITPTSGNAGVKGKGGKGGAGFDFMTRVYALEDRRSVEDPDTQTLPIEKPFRKSFFPGDEYAKLRERNFSRMDTTAKTANRANKESANRPVFLSQGMAITNARISIKKLKGF